MVDDDVHLSNSSLATVDVSTCRNTIPCEVILHRRVIFVDVHWLHQA
jgi:hypothetical protein